MNNKMFGKCLNCDQDYCQECSDNDNWREYCSSECEKEAKIDQLAKGE